MPTAAQVEKYLREIDSRRVYSNYGPLVLRLEYELSRHVGCTEDRITTVASATAGITAALLALNVPDGSVCLMPSWTFVATPHAVVAAGMQPWFHDVNEHTWALDPEEVARTIRRSFGGIGAVIVVSPFGAPLDLAAWEDLQEKSGVPVIVDAAAGFDTVHASSLISVVSLHATKMLGAGEGGFLVTPTADMRDRVISCCNFGFEGSRIARRRALNGKMSEYHAAVALASLESWPVVRFRHLQIMNWYCNAIMRVSGVSLQPGYGEGWLCSTTNVLLRSRSAESVSRELLRQGVETRMWWGQGCHVQPAFARCPRTELPVTESLASRVLGLPHFVDLKKVEVERIVSALGANL